MKRLFSIVALLSLLAPCAFAQMPKSKSVVEAEVVKEVRDSATRRYTGLVVSRAVVQMVPRVSGEILKVGFEDGSYVKAGQLLYKLDSTQYEASVKVAEAKITECKAKVEYTQNNFDRMNLLYGTNAASLDSMQNAKSALEANKAALLSAEAELITAKDNLKNTSITAPIDGVVGVTNYTRGNYITPSSGVLITIIQTQPIRVRFSISTRDFLSMFGSFKEITSNASVTLGLADGTKYGEEGVIELLNNEANSKTDAVQVYAQFPNRDFRLLVGSTVVVTLSKKVGRTLPAVTPSAVMHDNNGSYVYVLNEKNVAEKRVVIPGDSNGELQMIESGLAKGERVVVKGTHKVIPGTEVEIGGAVAPAQKAPSKAE